MELKDFNYHLPKELIAQKPIKPRDHSRLLVLDLKKAAPKALNKVTELLQKISFCSNSVTIEHKHFYDIIDYLRAGDVLVLNNSKVFPARLIGRKTGTGGKLEVFLHQKIRGSLWQCLLGGHGRKEGLEIEFYHCRNKALPCLKCKIIKNNHDGTWDVKFNKPGSEMMKIVNEIGLTPLPPYINRKSDVGNRMSDKKDYQTVYADERKIGSIAAPTAGFHFTPRLIKKLKAKGVQFEYITLHVGLGTFAPVKIDNITKHKMHAEWVEVKKDVLQRIIRAKQERRRIIAVGTTSVRTLEGLIAKQLNKPFDQITNYKLPITTFIYPEYKFKVVDAIITNFHLPKSTLLMLVMAFASKDNIDKAYRIAIRKKYRFYSYGDAMFIY